MRRHEIPMVRSTPSVDSPSSPGESWGLAPTKRRLAHDRLEAMRRARRTAGARADGEPAAGPREETAPAAAAGAG